nr:hypothetical protein [Ectothiorhodospiraceae bacterium AqS1]
MNMGERPCTVRKYASTQVRKYASTLKTSAILVASLAGLWFGTMGQVSASTESESVQVVTARPSAEDCGTGYDNVAVRWGLIMEDYEYRGKYTLDEFKIAMNNLLTSPELINCRDHNTGDGGTVAHMALNTFSIQGAKWAISKGVDLTITRIDGFTAYELTLGDISVPRYREVLRQLAQILKPPPAAATRSCAEVDGQTPPANEYCIVAENLQSSIETEVSQSLKRLIGVDYRYNTDKSLSGTALYPGYKATITFTCASGIQDCGPAYVPGDRWSDNFLNLVKKTFGLSVKCGDSGNLLDVDSSEMAFKMAGSMCFREGAK